MGREEALKHGLTVLNRLRPAIQCCEWEGCEEKKKPGYAYCAGHLEQGRQKDSRDEEGWQRDFDRSGA